MATDLIKALSAKFPAKEVKQRKGDDGKALDYLPINKVEERLNEILGAGWSWEITQCTVDVAGLSCVITGRLTYHAEDGSIHHKDGIGADVGISRSGKAFKDLDNVCKTAEAEALKKAAVKLGVGLYLWNEDDRAELEQERKGKKVVELTPQQQDPDWQKASGFFRSVLMEASKDLGKNIAEVTLKAKDLAKSSYGTDSSKNLTAKQLNDLGHVIRTNPKVLLGEAAEEVIEL